ncbi:MAG TPA: hypothetical protein DDZ68_03085 [Parvularcula sp.]|nr:hypothetical protein [Parvularcula sp.]HBS30236.1 hypothetical protein [Parvularcula sp.]
MENVDELFEAANAAKFNFDDVYNLPDPRRYYRTLGALDYRIPSEARPVFEAVIDALAPASPTIVDVGCSYGVNAAMIKYGLDFADLVARYRATSARASSVAETIFDDAAFYADRAVMREAKFVGVDIAAEAAGYGKAVGLLDEAVTQNLEAAPASARTAWAVEGADLIITTGAVGYVTEQTFEAIMVAAKGAPPCVAAFSLRQFPFDRIADRLADFGLDAEKLEGRYFPQRKFADAEEMAGALSALDALGIDAKGLESEGRYFAEFYFAAPRSGPKLSDLDL